MHDYTKAVAVQAILAAFYESQGGLKNIALSDLAGDTLPAVRDGWMQISEEMVRFGQTFYSSRDIYPLLAHAAADLPHNLTWRSGLAPAPIGFCFVDPFANGDEPFIFGWRTDPESAYITIFREMKHEESDHQTLLPYRSVRWDSGRSLKSLEEGDENDVYPSSPIRLIAALFVFMNQRIFTSYSRVLPRHARRRLHRETGLIHEPVVQVIELRRRFYRPHAMNESVDREYNCQWMVSGHWRQQWYPSLNSHQPKWIAPYVKGPEDKPLKPPRAKVFAVVR